MAAPSPSAGLDALARAYGLGAVRSCRYLPDGLLNRNWRIEAGRGVFALKELVDLDAGRARRSLGLLPRLAAAGVPVAEPVPDAAGATVAEIGGHAYYLCRWIEGGHPRGAEMDAGSAFHHGAVLGRVHRVLADPATGLPAPEPPERRETTPAEARERIGHYRDLIAGRAAPDAFDAAADRVLRERLELLAAHGHRRPADGDPTGPYGWIHGDCQNWNLLWSGGRIAAVLDWDRVRVDPYAEEIVRAAMYQFALPDGSVDLGNVAALLDGYRGEAPVPAALAGAARRRWWRLASGAWHLEYHYDLRHPAIDALFFADDRLLRWWTANLDAVEAVLAA